MHGNADTTLETATDVVAVPGNSHGYQGVDTRCSEEGTGILDAGLAGTGEHSEADDSRGFMGKHENTTLLRTVGKETSADGENTSNDIRGNSHKLTVFVGVAHVLDNAVTWY